MPFIRERLTHRAPSRAGLARFIVGLVLLVGLALTTPTIHAAATLSVSPASASPGDSLTVSWTGISKPRRHDWLGLYTPGAPDVAIRAHAYTTGSANGTVAFSLPPSLAAGAYEVRLFSNAVFRRIAVSNTFKVQPPPSSATLTVTPVTVAPGEAVTATWTDVAGAAPNDWIGLFKPKASDVALRGYAQTTGAASGTLVFPIPSRLGPGTYELRLFSKGRFIRLAVSNRFTVADRPSQPPPPTTASLTASPANVVTGGTITAAWSGLAAPASSDWIGLFLQEASDSAYVARQDTGGTAAGHAGIAVPAALAAGVYQLRLFGSGGVTRLATSNDVNISQPAPKVALAVSPASVALGATVTAAWTGIPAPAPDDWVGLFRNGASDSAFIARSETGATAAGNVAITVPLSADIGSYELRLFAASGSARLAVSNALTVTPAPEAQIYFIHTDHLNTPRVITNAAGQAVWRWDNMDPFGMNAPDENPSGLGAFTCNLRFPGQYFDRETNLHYNYYRSYSAELGNYVESDPIGIVLYRSAASANLLQRIPTDTSLALLLFRENPDYNHPYIYARGNPIGYTDALGLDATNWNNTSGGRTRLKGPTNGNWGGKCWSGGQYSCGPKNTPGSAPPTDSADRCYKDHDECYMRCKGDRSCIRSCDDVLTGDLMKLPDDPRLWPDPPRPGTEGDSRRFRQWALRYFR